ECTRFDDDSDLMRANAAGDGWATVGAHCLAAVTEAAAAHASTEGLFDPRVLGALRRLGYEATFAEVRARDRIAPAVPLDGRWRPGIDPARSAVRIGVDPIDLGGIGKGLALSWAADRLRTDGAAEFLLDAGRDCVAVGGGPAGDGWRVGVENPAGGERPVAVLRLSDRAVATSSTRVRHWRAGGRTVHHLIDPRTGDCGDTTLAAVTVVAEDPAEAEVWSKVLFLHGVDAIGAAAAERDLAAVWVTTGGAVTITGPARPYVVWQDA
ncbi:MAG: FAD:protein FMN transferase, partial [Jatrophihabitans sp.]|uniref:FAD:protein FMN transferase n=1 Tax=Jatrophihabitans sp. TaxID=1932789 RepID=UPI003F7DA8D8